LQVELVVALCLCTRQRALGLLLAHRRELFTHLRQQLLALFKLLVHFLLNLSNGFSRTVARARSGG
jgi:hypothetical protein